MVYSDLIFILGMFPIMTIISLFDRSAEYKNLILIVCSLLFFSWGRPFAFCLIFLSVILDWIFGLIISKNRENKALCRIFLVLDIIMNVSLMLIFGQNILYNKVKSSVLTPPYFHLVWVIICSEEFLMSMTFSRATAKQKKTFSAF